jgi:hypothetical protein
MVDYGDEVLVYGREEGRATLSGGTIGSDLPSARPVCSTALRGTVHRPGCWGPDRRRLARCIGGCGLRSGGGHDGQPESIDA